MNDTDETRVTETEIDELLREVLAEDRKRGERLARKFHDTYEKYAPQFGYETRKDTRVFDPASDNGRLMQAVVAEVMIETTRKAFAAGEQNERDKGDHARLTAEVAEKTEALREALTHLSEHTSYGQRLQAVLDKWSDAEQEDKGL